MFAPSLLLLGCLACMAAAHPLQSDGEQETLMRDRRSAMAARTMIMIRGHQAGSGSDRSFKPRAAMAAYATGGTVAAGSFYGASSQKQKCGDCNEHPEDEETKSVDPPAPEEAPEEVEEKEDVPERKAKAPKTPPKRLPVDEDEDADDDDDAPRRGGGSGSVYKNFFPMSFGAGSRSRLRAADNEEEDGGDGGHRGITAIANSFGKGRGAVASSSAVAHGTSDGSQQKQSQQSRYRARA